MKKIFLYKGRGVKRCQSDIFALVDDEDFEFLNQWKWGCTTKQGNTYYACRSVRIDGKLITYFMHRVIMGLQKSDKRVVDHKDRNGLNCQRVNIRICTQSQNNMNKTKVTKITSSIYKGVLFRKDTKKWSACIKQNQKTIAIGCFDKEIDAAIAYNLKAKEMFGSYALLNNIV